MNARAGKAANGRTTMLPVLLACSFSASFVQNMMNIALPQASERFGVTLSVANWLIIGYTVVAATAIMMAAFLLGRLGLRRLFLVAAGALVAGSAFAFVAPDFLTLLGCRLVQAVGTGLFYPTVTGVIMTVSAKKDVGVHLALNSGAIAVVLAVSPLVSGLVLTYVGWKALFAAPLALSVALMAGGFFLVRDIGARRAGAADLPSVGLGLVGLGALVFGLSEITHLIMPSLVALVAGAAVLALFVRRQFALKSPLLDLHPLVHPRFAVGMVLVMVGTMASYSLSVLLPLFFEGANGSTAFAAGLLLLGPVLVNAASSFAGGKLYDRVGAWPLIPAGLTLVVAGQVALFFLSEHLLVGLVVLSAALIYVGQGLAYTPSKTTALRQLPPDLYPHGASINSTLVQVASSIGSSLFVGVLSADVLRGTAAGLAKTQAYADGFAHTLAIAMGIVAVGLVVGFLYARAMRKPSLPKNKKV